MGMTCGMLGFLAFHYVRLLAPIKPAAQETAQPPAEAADGTGGESGPLETPDTTPQA